MSCPEIETERLTLRGHRLDDFANSFEMWSDPVVTRFIGGQASTEQQAWFRLLNYAGHWSLLHFGYWAVEEKASRRFIGELGFANFKRVIDSEMRDAPELGWVFASQAHGRGLATEAVRAIVSWGDKRFPTTRTVCLINGDNLTSIRVAEKCGYKIFRHAEYNGKPTLFLERQVDVEH